jgi:DNA mismatch repair ATPase MutL
MRRRGHERDVAPSARVEPEAPVTEDFPLGVARAQLHETYVIAQTRDGIVIVDQHAAHERLVYEDMKRQMAAGGVKRQALLIPDVVELTEDEAARVWSAPMSWPSWVWRSSLSVPALSACAPPPPCSGRWTPRA